MSEQPLSSVTTSQHRADELIHWLGDYAKTRINSQLIDKRRCIPPYVLMDLGNRGLLGMQIPTAYGGLALSNYDFMRVMQQLAAIDLTIATQVSLNNTLGVRPILGFATPEVKNELLPILARGRELAAFGMTEPDAGADIGTISTVATSDGRGSWRIRGIKRWNGFSWAGMINVFARVEDKKSGQRALTGFVVRQGASGLKIGPESLTMGLRGIVQNSLSFNDVPVGSSQILGELGKGNEPADDAVTFARLGIGSIAIGGMKRCAQLMLRYASRRSIATGRLLDSPVTLAKLNSVTLSTLCLESLMTYLTKRLDEGISIPREAAIAAKIAGSEYLWLAADSLMQMLGGRGYMENNLAPQLLRDARVLRIGEGPNESLKIFLGKSIVHGEAVHKLLDEQLGSPTLAHRLKAAADFAQSRCIKSNQTFANHSSASAWVYSLTGDAGVSALLLSAVKAASAHQLTNDYQQAIDWAQNEFDNRLEKLLTASSAEQLLISSTQMSQRISTYTQSINDIEQTLAGEDHARDPWLSHTDSTIVPITGRSAKQESASLPQPISTSPLTATNTATAAAPSEPQTTYLASEIAQAHLLVDEIVSTLPKS